MKFRVMTTCLALSLLGAGFAESLAAWEVVLQSAISTSEAVIRLKDIAEVKGLAAAETQRVESVVLAPGPSRAYSRTISASQIRKVLEGHGVAVDNCQLHGAPRTVVTLARVEQVARISTDDELQQPKRDPWKVTRAPNYRSRGGQTLVEQCEAAVSEAIGQQLQPRTDHAAPWHVTVAVATSALPDLPEQWDSVKVEGLDRPAAGEHPVVANFASQQGAARIPATVVLKPQVPVVMPVRAIPRNAVIRPEDVAVRHTVETDITGAARGLEEVVGRHVELALRPDEAIPLNALRTPVVVRRREELEIIARRGGIVVRDKARAIDEGAVGDVITVERLDDAKTRLVVRVTGVRQAEVFASGVAAMPSARSTVSTRLGPSPVRASVR